MTSELPRVLLVDDEVEFAQTLAERLRHRDYTVEVGFDGEQALNLMERFPAQVVVLDLKIPGMDGLETLRHIRQHYINVKVIILTGHGSQREEALARELGAFDYLIKPINIEVLSSRIRKAYKIRKA